ncbi:MAG: 2'-5' RNA ligase family protein, partial [Thermoanaerobaculia bacterium]
MRAFLAVPADPHWVESGRRLLERLRPASPRGSWTRPESWHLTLKFLGEVSEENAGAFAEALEAAGICAARGGELSASGAVAFPPRGHPRVLGVGLTASPALE